MNISIEQNGEDPNFSFPEYLHLGGKMVNNLVAGEYQALLTYLREHAEENATLGDTEKRLLINIFDKFLASLESSNIELRYEDLKFLSEIKTVLILFELESSGYEPERLKTLIRKKITRREPLADFLGKPFAFVIKFDSRTPVQIPADQALDLYREVLKEMSPEQARQFHNMQLLHYYALLPGEYLIKYALRKLKSSYP